MARRKVRGGQETAGAHHCPSALEVGIALGVKVRDFHLGADQLLTQLRELLDRFFGQRVVHRAGVVVIIDLLLQAARIRERQAMRSSVRARSGRRGSGTDENESRFA